MHEPGDSIRPERIPWLFAVLTALAAAGQLAVGYLYVVSGLIAPGWAVALFLLWWLALTFVGVRLTLRKSYWLLLVPVMALATWIGGMWAGGVLLGWTA